MTPWTIACQVPLSMGFSRQEYWSGLPCPPPGDLPNPGVEPRSPALQGNSLPAELLAKTFFSNKPFICFTVLGFFAEFFLQRRQGLRSCFQWTRPPNHNEIQTAGPYLNPTFPSSLSPTGYAVASWLLFISLTWGPNTCYPLYLECYCL